MKNLKATRIFLTCAFVSAASPVYADVIWPALYVADSHFRFWYVVVVGLLLEAAVLRWKLLRTMKKALLVSTVANAISATVGIYVLAFGMLGWHLVVDRFLDGTFNTINKISTLIIMLVGSVLVEALVALVIWGYSLRRTLPIFVLGNLLSYGVIVADLYLLGGWNRSF